MDYSKWKKIFYILMIVSLVINICSKVFGSYDLTGTNDSTYKLPDAFANYNYVLVITPTRSWDWTFIYASNSEFVVSNNSTSSSFNIGFSSPNTPFAYSQKTGVSGTDFSSFTVNTATSPNSLSNGIYDITSANTYRNIVVSTFDLKKVNGTTFFANTNPVELTVPEICNSLDNLQNLNYNYLTVDLHDYSEEDVYLLVYDYSSFEETEETEEEDYDKMFKDMVGDLIDLYTAGLAGTSSSSSSSSEEEDSVREYYPVNEIRIKDYYKQKNSIYSIPASALGVEYKNGGKYAFRFAIREDLAEPIEMNSSGGGGSIGSRDSTITWRYSYLGDYLRFEVTAGVSDARIDELNKQAEEDKVNKEREEDIALQQEQTNAIREQSEQQQEFYNNILSNDYDENQANDTLSGMTSSSDNIDDSEYTGLFSAIFNKFSNIINGDYSSPESIRYPIMNTNEEIVITSDLLSSKIQGTFIYTFLQIFWYFLFGMYIFKFSNNLIRKIKSGDILNGYENNDEVITSTML